MIEQGFKERVCTECKHNGKCNLEEVSFEKCFDGLGINLPNGVPFDLMIIALVFLLAGGNKQC